MLVAADVSIGGLSFLFGANRENAKRPDGTGRLFEDEVSLYS